MQESATNTKQLHISTKFITGLRGYSALAVFLIHCGDVFRSWSYFADKFVGFGEYGVIVFFVISAFTITMSLDCDKNFTFPRYLYRRYLRIAPLYYLVVTTCFCIGGIAYYKNMFSVPKYSLIDYITHISFINLFDIRYRNTLAAVEWTIPLEFAYYVALPLIIFVTRRYWSIMASMFFVGLFLYLNKTTIFRPYGYTVDPTLAFHWSLEKYLFVYLSGIIAFQLIFDGNQTNSQRRWDVYGMCMVIVSAFIYVAQHVTLGENIILLSLLALLGWIKFIKPRVQEFRKVVSFSLNTEVIVLIAILLAYIYADLPHKELFLSVWTVVLTVACMSRALLVQLVFENRAIQYVGTISYSLYLLHFPIMSVVTKFFATGVTGFIISLVITLCASSISYYLIEETFIKLGKGSRTSLWQTLTRLFSSGMRSSAVEVSKP